jgi:hypothetical protein
MEKNFAEYDLDVPSALLRQIIARELEKEPERIDSDFVDFLVRELYAQEQAALPQASREQIAAVTRSIKEISTNSKGVRREPEAVSRKFRKFCRWSSIACAAVALFLFANVVMMQLGGTCLIGEAGFTFFCDRINGHPDHHSEKEALVHTADRCFEKIQLQQKGERQAYENFMYAYT